MRFPESQIRSAEAAPQAAAVEIMPPGAENDSHQIRRATIVCTNARISAPRNTSRWLNMNTYAIYDRKNLSRSFESVPNASNRSVFDAPCDFQGLKSGPCKDELEINDIQWNGHSELEFSWIFMDFPNQLQLVATLSPISGRVWECWDTFLLVPARDLAI